MDKEKYYTPNLSELHVGFELEFKSVIKDKEGNPQVLHDWQKEICNQDLLFLAFNTYEHEDYEGEFADIFRVKYLSKECIEECGFHQTDHKQKTPYNQISPVLSETIEFKHERLNIALSFMPERSTVFIFEVRDDGEIAFCLFAGKCYNKSELRWIMERLGINTEKDQT